MEHLPAFAAGMGVLVAICGAVYFVIRKETDPLSKRVDRLEANDSNAMGTPLGHMITRHAADDDARFAEIKGLIAEGRKENQDNFAELRSAVSKRGRA